MFSSFSIVTISVVLSFIVQCVMFLWVVREGLSFFCCPLIYVFYNVYICFHLSVYTFCFIHDGMHFLKICSLIVVSVVSMRVVLSVELLLFVRIMKVN